MCVFYERERESAFLEYAIYAPNAAMGFIAT